MRCGGACFPVPALALRRAHALEKAQGELAVPHTSNGKTLRERAGDYVLYGAGAGLAWGLGSSLYVTQKVGMSLASTCAMVFLGTGSAIVYGAVAGLLAALAVSGGLALLRRARAGKGA